MNWTNPSLEDRLDALLNGLRTPSFQEMQDNPELGPPEIERTVFQHNKTMLKAYAAQCLARLVQSHGEHFDGVKILAAQGNTWSLKDCICVEWKDGTPARTIVEGEKSMSTMRKKIGASRQTSENVLPVGGRDAYVHSQDATAFMEALGVDQDLVAALKGHLLEQALPQSNPGTYKPRM